VNYPLSRSRAVLSFLFTFFSNLRRQGTFDSSSFLLFLLRTRFSALFSNGKPVGLFGCGTQEIPFHFFFFFSFRIMIIFFIGFRNFSAASKEIFLHLHPPPKMIIFQKYGPSPCPEVHSSPEFQQRPFWKGPPSPAPFSHIGDLLSDPPSPPFLMPIKDPFLLATPPPSSKENPRFPFPRYRPAIVSTILGGNSPILFSRGVVYFLAKRFPPVLAEGNFPPFAPFGIVPPTHRALSLPERSPFSFRPPPQIEGDTFFPFIRLGRRLFFFFSFTYSFPL